MVHLGKLHGHASQEHLWDSHHPEVSRPLPLIGRAKQHIACLPLEKAVKYKEAATGLRNPQTARCWKLGEHFREVSVASALVLYLSRGQKGLALFSSLPQMYLMEEKNLIQCASVFTRPHRKKRLHEELPHSSSLSLPSTHDPVGTSRHK